MLQKNQPATRTNKVLAWVSASTVFVFFLFIFVLHLNLGVHFILSPSGGDGGSGGIMEWVFAPFQQSLHMASCLLCLFIASFWETLCSPRMQHKPKHLSVPSPEPVTQGMLLFLPYFSPHTFSHLSPTPPTHTHTPTSRPSFPSSQAGHRFFVFGAQALGWYVSHSVAFETQALGFGYDKFNMMCSWFIVVTFQSHPSHHLHFAVERMSIILGMVESLGQLCWFIVKVCWPGPAGYYSLPNVVKCCYLHITVWETAPPPKSD